MNNADAKPTKKSKRSNSSSKEMQNVLKQLKQVMLTIGNGCYEILRIIGSSLKKAKANFLKSFAKWADPKLEPYRERPRVQLEKSIESPGKPDRIEVIPSEKDNSVIIEESVFTPVTPQSRDDLFALIREAPMTILSSQERKAMAAILSLPDVWVSEIMTPAIKIVFVKQDEVLGPLVLDKLYRSGFTYFPVIDAKTHIIGTLHTAALNSLDVKETLEAVKVMEPRVYYIRDDYTLEQALKAFLRTNSKLMLVVDRYEKLKGMLTFEQLMDYLFSEKYRDDFDRDDDRLAVAKRKG